MNRFTRVFAAAGLLALAACSGKGTSGQPSDAVKGPGDVVTIVVFQAAPDTIAPGQSSKLIFVVQPNEATVRIDGIGDVTGKTVLTVTPSVTTTYHLVATKGKLTADATTTVTIQPPRGAQTALKLTAATSSPVAGQPVSVTVTAIDSTGATATGYRGTVHLTSSDASATLPADVTFTAADAGVKQVSVTLTKAGFNTVNAVDTASLAIQGQVGVITQPAAAASCAASQQSATSIAGASVGLTVTVHDPFGNVATGYAGTVHLSSTDARANLPADSTFVPSTDAGSHAFSAALLTAGTQTLTATDVANPAIQCSAVVAVLPAAAAIGLTVAADANAGFPVSVGVNVRDAFGNPITNYAGTVTFTSTDTAAGAVTPASIVFTGSEGGVATTSATFISVGSQTLSATDGAATGSAKTAVHGLVYTGPDQGRVRLVVNTAQSNAQVVQLDLVANERLEISTFFGGGPGSFAAGMNLPLDTTRVGADTTLFTAGNALPAGAGLAAASGTIGADHVLYTVVSRKRSASSIFAQVADVLPGRAFYSVRLKLQPTATRGPVFDGANPPALFRASVMDQYGNDFVTQSDIAIGRLEVL
jgi:hypothetical protein